MRWRGLTLADCISVSVCVYMFVYSQLQNDIQDGEREIKDVNTWRIQNL